jgi:ubiquitin carboxyl-terminal hydrolase 5/13
MESIQALTSKCRVAAAHDSVLNTECCYTFYSPYNNVQQGILVNLDTFMGTVQELAMLSVEGSQECLFVRIVKERVYKETADAMEVTEEEAEAPVTVTKLGVGVAGGFLSDEQKYETLSKYSVVVLRKNSDDDGVTVVSELPYSEDTKASFPEQVSASVDSILHHVGQAVQQDVKVWQLDADEDIVVSKYAADLPFCENGVVIHPNPATWKCQKTGAVENLWLNLSDGYIGGGRQNWDGSGGSNGALDHYQEETTKQVKYPLVVKLGTITADLETADCYSYAPDEDGPVKIPNLAALLQKRGILVASMYVHICLCFD